MKLRVLLFVFFMAATIIINSCKKEAEPLPERPVPEYKLPDDFLRYFAFKPGSYWVYQNKLNGLYDTVTVTKYLFGYHTLVSTNGNKALYKFEDFTGEMVSTYYQASYYYNTVLSAQNIDKNFQNLCYSLEVSNSGPWGSEPESYLMYYPLKKSDSLFGVRVINEKDTVNYKSVTLNNIINIKIPSCRLYYNSPGMIKIGKNIGIVYKENSNTNVDSWILVDYKTYY